MVSANSNSVAKKFGYNGVENEEALGLNLMEMDMRQYDAAIGRWTGIDPVTHYAMSPYNAFDNNPVYWADPSGADAEENWRPDIDDSDTMNVAHWSDAYRNGGDGEEVDPVKVKTTISKEVKSVHDLGVTGISDMRLFKNKLGEFELQIDISVAVNKSLSPGSIIGSENPGLRDEVQAHEDGHYDQMVDVLTNERFTFTIGNDVFTGCLDVCTNDIVNAYQKKTKNQKEFNKAIGAFFQQTASQTNALMLKKYGNEIEIENNAVRRADQTIRNNGKVPVYQNINGNNKKITKNGKVLPSN